MDEEAGLGASSASSGSKGAHINSILAGRDVNFISNIFGIGGSLNITTTGFAIILLSSAIIYQYINPVQNSGYVLFFILYAGYIVLFLVATKRIFDSGESKYFSIICLRIASRTRSFVDSLTFVLLLALNCYLVFYLYDFLYEEEIICLVIVGENYRFVTTAQDIFMNLSYDYQTYFYDGKSLFLPSRSQDPIASLSCADYGLYFGWIGYWIFIYSPYVMLILFTISFFQTLIKIKTMLSLK